jgi:hypothetical protein
LKDLRNPPESSADEVTPAGKAGEA